MTEVGKGQPNLSQLAIQGNYRAVDAQDMDKVYSRNIAKQQLFASKFAQSAFQENKIAEPIAGGPPVFSEEKFTGETSLDTEFHGLKQADRALNILKKMESSGVLKKDRMAARSSSGEIVVSNAQVDTADRSETITTKGGPCGGNSNL